MQVDIDFEVYKALTALRQNETDSYNAVLRRMLKLQTPNALSPIAQSQPRSVLDGITAGEPTNALAAVGKGRVTAAPRFNALLGNGALFDGIFFPNGTLFRATYKGELFSAEIGDGQWIGSDGIVRTSPSAAAGAISNTNVNGWRFWFYKGPGEASWKRLDNLKK